MTDATAEARATTRGFIDVTILPGNERAALLSGNAAQSGRLNCPRFPTLA